MITPGRFAVVSSADNPADLEALAACAGALAEGIERALPGWVERSVRERAGGERGDLVPAAAAAGRAAAAAVGPVVRALLALDVDAQRVNPLEVVRGAVRFPTAVLAEAGVAPLGRDEVRVRLFPDDAYDLAPATFADLDPDLGSAGIAWGAAKAHVILARRRSEGRR